MVLTLINLIKTPSPDDVSNKKKLLKQVLVELVATTVFVYFGTMSAVSTGTKLGGGSGSGEDVARVFPIAFTFGITIMCLVYAIGHITGGHMNPGVSLLMFFQREISFLKMITYWLGQLIGALLGSSLVLGSVSSLVGQTRGTETFAEAPFQLGSTTLDDQISSGNGFLLELMGSFFFYFVISQCALDAKGISKTIIPAIPIGFSLVVVHICLVPFTGCGVNPARTFGPAMITCWSGGDCDVAIQGWWWIYYIGPFLAAYLVAEITHLMNWEVDEEETYTETKQQEAEVEDEADVEN